MGALNLHDITLEPRLPGSIASLAATQDALSTQDPFSTYDAMTETGADAPSVGPLQLEADQTIGTGYRLCARLGQGAVGEVWEARDPRGEQVAVKLLRPDLGCNETRRARFLREGRLASTLCHPHIVEVHEVSDTSESVPFLVMERLPGPSLDETVEAEGPLPWSRVRQILLQLCYALAHAHERGIVHHDVKPSNVVMGSEEGQPDVTKLVDFGIARGNLVLGPDEQLTVEGQVLGSPGYMSPEQLRGKRANPRSDLFGLGCTAYHLLTGRAPIQANSVIAMVHATIFRPSPPLGDIGLDPMRQQAIEAMIHRAMAKDPADRFASAHEMAEAIASIAV